MSTVAGPLAAELAAQWARWQPWLSDPIPDEIAAAIPLAAAIASAHLTGTDPDRAASTAYDIVDIVHGHNRPPAEWWTTPLGRAVARALPDKTVTYPEAARILGLSRQRVHVLARDGLLTSPVTGYVTLTSVLARLTTRQATR